jgi:hypothetical protein
MMKAIIKIPRTTRMYHQCVLNEKMEPFAALTRVYEKHFGEGAHLLKEEEIQRLSPEERDLVVRRRLKL